MTQTHFATHYGGAYGVGAYGGGPYSGNKPYDLPVTAFANRPRQSTQWETCGRCGFSYPQALFRIQPGDMGGVKVCTVSCLDEPSVNDLRPPMLPTEKPLTFVDEEGPTG